MMNKYEWDRHIEEHLLIVYYKNGTKKNFYFKKYKNAEKKAQKLKGDPNVLQLFIEYIERP